MKLTTLTAAIAAAVMIVQSAQARELRHRHEISFPAGHLTTLSGGTARYFDSVTQTSAYDLSGAHPTLSGYGGRPAAWCGWAMRQLVGSDPGPQFNLARNWARWGHAGPPGIGAVVVWPHHVGKIVGQENGKWIVQSGNDGGNMMRTRPRSISGAIAFRWG